VSRRSLPLLWLSIAALGGLAWSFGRLAEAGNLKVSKFDGTLSLDEGGLGPRLVAPKRAPHASNHGSTIAADAQGLWIAERNAGALIRTDHAGEVRATIELHAGLGELVLDEVHATLFVADRAADRVLRYKLAGDVATSNGEIELPEPHGLALTPDGATLLVTSVADHELIAIDTTTMQVRWRVELAPEPRAVAVSPEGRWALVGFLTSEAIARVELGSQKVEWQALSPRDHVVVETEDFEWGPEGAVEIVEAVSRFEVPNDIGRRHVRNVFGIAYVGDGIAVVAHHLATSQMELLPDIERRDSYGGGAADVAPIEYRFARISEPAADGLVDVDQHDLGIHQPRAIAYDPIRDVLYIGGYGDDEVVAIGSASRERPMLLWTAALGGGAACGVDGLTAAGDHVWAHCELARRVVRIDLEPGHPKDPSPAPVKSSEWVRGPELAKSLRSKEVERGAELFRRGEDWKLGGPLACASCHPEGRSDALSWRLGRSILQTPMLAGRVVETGPYKWTGEDSSLRESFAHTLERIGGDPDELASGDFSALAAYITSLPNPRAPTVREPEAVTRGRALFERECAVCHAGERTTDRERHEFQTTLRKVDTPSLIGLAHTAPYYHDGSAIDLATLLDDRGSIHDMVDTSALKPDERRDLIAFLESL
jgi:cytochrome c